MSESNALMMALEHQQIPLLSPLDLFFSVVDVYVCVGVWVSIRERERERQKDYLCVCFKRNSFSLWRLHGACDLCAFKHVSKVRKNFGKNPFQ